ncbi:cathepsin E-like [Macrosteles quadrilineatus]|uniref:cathepsin E-like n=1 Tax=Macrosteles quadrilineatus TaxID=74068 RepID=UPI0023E0E9C9|nr:cathepsin E-like [Macrosteles quadrilineatus]
MKMFVCNSFTQNIVTVLWMLSSLDLGLAGISIIEVPLTKIRSNYYGYIRVGTPLEEDGEDQIFRVNFDTGSQHLWLITTEACKNPDCKEEKFTPYDKTKSKTYTKIDDRPFSLSYSDGTEVNGHLGSDVLKIGVEGKRAEFTQVIGFASSAKGVFRDYDGIFGLGLLTESLIPGEESPDPPMYTMNELYDIGEFSIYFSRVFNGDGAGKILFGGYDTELAMEPMHWHDVVSFDGDYQGYNIRLKKLIVETGGEKRKIEFENMLALPDSGCNVITGPFEQFDKLRNEIYSHATFKYSSTDIRSFKCNEDVSTLPNIVFVMDDKEYKMEPRDYIWVFPSGERCSVGIYGMETDHIVLGQVFMQAFYTHFNIEEKKVGFARANHS